MLENNEWVSASGNGGEFKVSLEKREKIMIFLAGSILAGNLLKNWDHSRHSTLATSSNCSNSTREVFSCETTVLPFFLVSIYPLMPRDTIQYSEKYQDDKFEYRYVHHPLSPVHSLINFQTHTTTNNHTIITI